MTQGQGVFTMEFATYRATPANIQKEIIEERKKQERAMAKRGWPDRALPEVAFRDDRIRTDPRRVGSGAARQRVIRTQELGIHLGAQRVLEESDAPAHERRHGAAGVVRRGLARLARWPQ